MIEVTYSEKTLVLRQEQSAIRNVRNAKTKILREANQTQRAVVLHELAASEDDPLPTIVSERAESSRRERRVDRRLVAPAETHWATSVA